MLNKNLIKNETGRNYSIDILRIICMLGVIVMHVHPSSLNAELFSLFFWPLSVPFFFITSLTYFISGLKRANTIKYVILKLANRLVLPFFSWTIIYFSLLFFKNIMIHQNKTFSLWRIFIYGESAVQMYYLPFLISLQLLAFGIFLFINKYSKQKMQGFILVMLSLSYFIIGDIFNCFGVGSSGQYYGLFIYISFSFYLSLKIKTIKTKFILLIFGLFLFCIVIIGLYFKINISLFDYWLLFPFGGLALLLIGIGFPIKKIPNWVISISNSIYGIYFIHIFFWEIIQTFFEKILKIKLVYNISAKIFIVLTIFAFSYIAVTLLKKNKYTRYILLGEN